MPDRTILLEIRADDAVGRMGGERDRIEREEDDFHARAARAYRQLAEREPDRYVVVDGTPRPRSSPRGSPPQWERCIERRPVRTRFRAARGEAAADRGARRRRRARVPLPRPCRGRQDGGCLRVRRRAARRRAPGRGTDAPGSAGDRATRGHDPGRRRSTLSTTTCISVPSRPTAACTSSSARTCSTSKPPSMLLKDLEEPPLYATIVLVADELGPTPRDDPLALPARPVPAAVRARHPRLARRAGTRARRRRSDSAGTRRRRPARPGPPADRPRRP